MHDVLSELSALRYTVDGLREWRAEVRVQFDAFSARCDELAEQIERVLKSDEIAEAIAAKVSERRADSLTSDSLDLSRWQVRLAAAGVALALAASIASPFLAKLA